MRSVWKGTLRFSLVTIPVEAFTAAEPEQVDIRLNQLHDKCHSRIQYKKTCPIHGEVGNDEIVTGYQYEKDHYVVVDRKEIEKEVDGDHSIAVETFIGPEEIDPIYFDGRTYYLAPANKGAEKPYGVLRDAMHRMDRYGIATVTLAGKQHAVLVRALKNVITMTMLHYKQEIREPEMLDDEVPSIKSNPQELKLAEQLIEASTQKHFDFGQFEDVQQDKLKELIEAKIKGRKIITPPHEESPATINLMDALRKSVQKSKRPERKRKKA